MADAQSNAALPASPLPEGVPLSGLIHVRHRHTSHFTVVGNHLTQHPGLSALAIGLGVHLLSLPDGAPVTVKALAARFPEGEITIRRGLNELVAAGYLERRRLPLGRGRFATRTVVRDVPWYGDHRPTPPDDGGPGARVGRFPTRAARPRRPAERTAAAPERAGTGAAAPYASACRYATDPRSHRHPPAAAPNAHAPATALDAHAPAAALDAHVPAAGVDGQGPAMGIDLRPPAGDAQGPAAGTQARPSSAHAPAPAQVPVGTRPAQVPVGTRYGQPGRTPGAGARPADVPGESAVGPAADLLARLRLADPRLLLPGRDIAALVPAVNTWLERGAAPEQITRALTAGLPAGLIHHPGRFLAHRLTVLLPPPLPPATPSPERPAPLHTCDGCDRAFRTHDPTARCADCRKPARTGAQRAA
jgi:hypothetical protein